MAEIYKTKRSPFWYITYVRDGVRHRESLKTTSKEHAKQLKTEYEQGGHRAGNITLGAASEEYLVYCETHHAPGTLWVDKAALDHFTRFAGDIPLSHITIKTMDGYKAERIGKAAPVTINRELGVIKAMMSYCVDRSLTGHNPFKSRDGKNMVRGMRIEERKVRFLSAKEISALLSVCDDTWRAVITFALNTGLRRDEVRFLRWESVDLSRRVLTVEPLGDFHTKSRRLRHIPINSQALHICSTLPKTGIFVFGGGKPFMPGHFNHKFKALALAAGLPGVGFHTLRHTFASHLVMAGVPIVTIQALLGHSNVQTTMVYAHLSRDHKADAVNVLALGAEAPTRSEA